MTNLPRFDIDNELHDIDVDIEKFISDGNPECGLEDLCYKLIYQLKECRDTNKAILLQNDNLRERYEVNTALLAARTKRMNELLAKLKAYED